MVAYYIETGLKKKIKYAYLTMKNFGFDGEDDDPWDPWYCKRNTSVYVAKYRFALQDLPVFEKTVKDYLAKHKQYIQWTTLEEALANHLAYTPTPTEYLEELFERAQVTYKKVFAKSVDISELPKLAE